jgi:methyl-accepting chemotaxis protein
MNKVDLDNNMVYLYGESVTLMNKLFDTVNQFNNLYTKQAQDSVTKTRALLDVTSTIMLGAAGFALAITLSVAFVLIRSFMQPIVRLQRAVSQIAAGDLRHKIESASRDELGQLSHSFDRMIDQVRDMLAGTQRIASSLSDHSETFYRFSQTTAAANEDIVKAIEEISRGSDQQAAQAEHSAVIISDLEREIVDIADSTDLMLAASQDAAFNTESGTAAVRALQQSSQQSQQTLEKVSEEFASLKISSEHVGSIIKAITDISAQTQVLALNAAIEAARAGAHGRGFSVIAEEVRKLAVETNQSSKRIAHIIAGLQEQMYGLENTMRAASAATTAQHAKVAETYVSFETIAISMERLSEQVNHIHERIDAAKNKNKTLVAAVHQVAAIAEETAAGVEEVNSTSAGQDASIRRIAEEAEEIRTLAQRLFGEINRFRITDDDLDETVPTAQIETHLAVQEPLREEENALPEIIEDASLVEDAPPVSQTPAVVSGMSPDTTKTAEAKPAAAAEDKELIKV